MEERNAVKFVMLGEPLLSREAIEAVCAGCAVSFDRDADNDCAAVFVFAGGDARVAPETVDGRIGHPHLRVIAGDSAEAQLDALRREVTAALGNEECERKFLVTYPDVGAMTASPFCADAHIVQTYLTSDREVTERVRMRESGGGVVYTHTVKRRLDRQTSEELEREIDRETYEALLLRADTARTPIEKTRWCILYEGQYFELDVYPFWSDRATVELEMTAESDAPIDFPPFFRVVREVTEDVRYKNARLAAEVPYDALD